MKVAGANPPTARSRCWTAPDEGLTSSSTTQKKFGTDETFVSRHQHRDWKTCASASESREHYLRIQSSEQTGKRQY